MRIRRNMDQRSNLLTNFIKQYISITSKNTSSLKTNSETLTHEVIIHTRSILFTVVTKWLSTSEHGHSIYTLNNSFIFKIKYHLIEALRKLKWFISRYFLNITPGLNCSVIYTIIKVKIQRGLLTTKSLNVKKCMKHIKKAAYFRQ